MSEETQEPVPLDRLAKIYRKIKERIDRLTQGSNVRQQRF